MKKRTNPKFKAFYEYGKARGRLEQFRYYKDWDYVRRLDRRHSARGGHHVSWEVQEIIDEHARLILDAWEKRAKCRFRCGTCRNFSLDEWGPGRHGCMQRYFEVKQDTCAAGCGFYALKPETK